jgi:hypothetical protein
MNATGQPEDTTDLDPGDALRFLAARVAAEGPPLAVVSQKPDAGPVLGMLAAAGSRTSANPGRYAFVLEAVREGYLCHYETSRVLEDPDPDLALLAGDLFYAIGIRALAELEDVESVRLLSELIRVSAELRSQGRCEDSGAVWLATVMALACGPDDEYDQLIAALARGEDGSREALESWSQCCGNENGLARNLREAREAIHSAFDT